MHPEIRKFWEKVGTVICIDKPTGSITNVPFYCVNIGTKSEAIAAMYDDDTLAYRLGDRWYTEEVMLRLIKIKAFL
jgi:hypothetical protein